MRAPHSWDYTTGECSTCDFAPIARSGDGNLFESVTEALEYAADTGTGYVELVRST